VTIRQTTARDRVSVVVVGHNNWPDLSLAIASALHQSHEPVEVIVVDNASTDETPRAVQERFGDAVRYLRQPRNLFDGGGYNAGVRAASGEFVQFLDADDFLAPDKIELQLRTFRDHPDADIVRGSYRRYQVTPGRADWEDRDLPQTGDVLTTLIRDDCAAAGLLVHNVLFRRRALEKIGPWDEEIVGVDLDYFLRAAWSGCRFADCPAALCFYQVRPGQMSTVRHTQRRNREKTLAKALSYVTTEPHRTVLTNKLAWFRFYDALSSGTLPRGERMAKLRAAAKGRSGLRSRISFGLGWCLIQVPGASTLLDVDALHAVRTTAAAILGIRPRRQELQ